MSSSPPPEQASPAAVLSLKDSPAPLSFWLQLMLAEIAAKREALERAHAEEALRGSELSRTEP